MRFGARSVALIPDFPSAWWLMDGQSSHAGAPEGTRTRSSDKFCCVTRVSVRRWHLGSKKPSVMLACGLCVRRASVVTRFPPRSVRREGSGFHVPVLHTEGVARALDARAGA